MDGRGVSEPQESVVGVPLLTETVRSFARHGGTLLAGACAFFALMSAAPMLFIAIAVAGAVTGEGPARAELLRGLGAWFGPSGAAAVGRWLDDVGGHTAGPLAGAAGILILVYASTRLFTQVQRALNHLWDVQARPARDLKGRLAGQIKKRLLSFVVVMFCAVLLAASVVVRAALVRAADAVGAGDRPELALLDHAGTFVVATLLFAVVFKLLPDVRIHGRDALAGASVTAALFVPGRALLGLYLGHKDVAAAFGAAGALVMVLLWVHYSAQIFFFGAAFTAAWARRRGRAIAPSENALRVRVDGERADGAAGH